MLHLIMLVDNVVDRPGAQNIDVERFAP